MKQCYFCTNGIKIIDYKEIEHLKKFLDYQERILKRREAGLCAGHQRKLALAVKRARFMALLPFVAK